jgi:hypothetical protein
MEFEVRYYVQSVYIAIVLVFLCIFLIQDWHQDKHGVERDSRRCHSALSQSSEFHMASDANLNKSGSSSYILVINRSFLGCDIISLGFQCIA